MKLSVAVIGSICPVLFIAYRQQSGALRVLEIIVEDGKERDRRNHEALRDVLRKMELGIHEKHWRLPRPRERHGATGPSQV